MHSKSWAKGGLGKARLRVEALLILHLHWQEVDDVAEELLVSLALFKIEHNQVAYFCEA
jgi:hypothetical protein